MKFYMPTLKFKQAEYSALGELSDSAKKLVFPLLELPPITYDFAEKQVPKTLEEQIAKNVSYLEKHWKGRAAFIDGTLIQKEKLVDGSCSIKLFFQELSTRAEKNILPVISIQNNQSYQDAICSLIKDGYVEGVCIRTFLEDYLEDDFEGKINSLISYLNISPKNIHFVLDLRTPANLSDYKSFAQVINGALISIPHYNEWISITLCGSAFPKSMSEIKAPGQTVIRSEWLLYKEVLKLLEKEHRVPNFGDYGIANTDYSDYNPKIMKGSASVKYTIDDAWYITKGTVLKKSSDFKQFINHSQLIKKSDFFCGANYSAGDKKLFEYAEGKMKTSGNLTTWKKIGFNHHFMKILNDLSATPGASLAVV